MKHIQKTVFISYRRTNTPWALCIFQNLTHEGYDVFFDYLSINNGDFGETIIENIKSRAHFILILTPSALERCKEPDDWLRKEIETAIDEKRNIVPLMLEGFDFSNKLVSKALNGKLAALKNYSALTVTAEYFDAAMEKLRNRFLNVDLSHITLSPLSKEAQKIAKTQAITASEALPVKEVSLTSQEWFERGFKEIDKSERIRCYSEAIKLNPDFPEAFYMRGMYYQEKDDIDCAIADYNEAIRLKPDYPEAYNNRGNAYQNEKKFVDAIADYTKSIALNNPKLYLPYNNRGHARRKMGDFWGAIKDYEEAVKLKPELPDLVDTYTYLGIMYETVGDLDKSVSTYEEVLSRKPTDVVAKSSLMSALRKMGRMSEAKMHEKNIRDSISKENEYNQACFESINGNTQKALELLEIAIQQIPSRREWAKNDPNFENIRNIPRFIELVSK
jgi:tetratricopeptide (TPR) repeat protein